MTKTSKHHSQQWDPSLSIVPMVLNALPALLDALNSPITHNHYHSHEHKLQGNPDTAQVNPYRNGQGIPKTVGELESWLLARPLDPDSDRMLQLLAQYPQDCPVARVKHLLT